MPKLAYDNFSPRPFDELDDGTGFVLLAENDSYFQEPHVWLTIYNAKVRAGGYFIRFGAYGYRNGSHGEGIEEFAPKKVVLPGRTIIRRPGKRQITPIAELLGRIMSYKPQGVTLEELSGSVRISRSPEKLAELQERLSWLIKLGSLRQDGDLFIVTGAGIERALSQGFKPNPALVRKSRSGLILGEI